MKIPLFSYIDDAIALKHELRFEIEEAQHALDSFFEQSFEHKDCFVNYTSRVKADDGLKEKIIRQNLLHMVSAEGLFAHISDLIGSRIECRFISDEEKIYRELFKLFPKKRSDGFYQCDRDPRIELRLDEPQPKSQKNGYRSYRIDGHFLGERVLNFELQIKSIVNVFWNEIDHKILYKNYNYVLTEKFVHDIMDSIMGDLVIIDRQMEMLYDQLRTLDSPQQFQARDQLKIMIGRLVQDAYLLPLREQYGVSFDFRLAIDLITDFLFARVEYESREQYATEFLRIMNDAFSGQRVLELFGERIVFDPPVHYHDPMTQDFGKRLETVANEDILWNLLVHILLDLNTHMKPRYLYRTFVDYLYFRVIDSVREAFREEGISIEEQEALIDAMTSGYLEHATAYRLLPQDFTAAGTASLKRNVAVTLRTESVEDPEAVLSHFRRFYPLRRKKTTTEEEREEAPKESENSAEAGSEKDLNQKE